MWLPASGSCRRVYGQQRFIDHGLIQPGYVVAKASHQLAALRQSTDSPPEDKVQSVDCMAHALSYGWYSHDLLFYADDLQYSRSVEEISASIEGIANMASVRSLFSLLVGFI